MAFLPVGMPMGAEVPTQEAHNAIAGLLYLGLITAPFMCFWKMRRFTVWQPSLKVIMWITALKMLTLLASVIAIFLNSDLVNYAGLLQKSGIFLDVVWTIFLSYQLVHLELPEFG